MVVVIRGGGDLSSCDGGSVVVMVIMVVMIVMVGMVRMVVVVVVVMVGFWWQ